MGGFATTVAAFVTTTYHCETPQGISQWGVNENFTPAKIFEDTGWERLI